MILTTGLGELIIILSAITNLSDKKALNEKVNIAIVKEYPDHTDIVKDILKTIDDLGDIKLGENELAYIVIHLVNIIGNDI